MNTFLRLHLEGSHQAWAEAGVGFSKGSAAFPTRSGVVGLVAASLGLFRDDPRIDGLHRALRASARVLRRGTTRVDYQNVRSWEPSGPAPAKPGKDFHTRCEQDLGITSTRKVLRNGVLVDEPVHPIRQVYRTYHMDAAFQVVLEVGAGSPFTPEQVLAALRRPMMPVYLGRKNCGLSFPLVGADDVPVEASSPVDAFGPVPDYVRVAYLPWLGPSEEEWLARRYPEAATLITSLDLPPGVSVPSRGHSVRVEVGDAMTSNRARSFSTRVAHLWSEKES